jgi:valyl-tRNA synthetase
MPFVTETIWQELPEQMKDSDLLMVAKWPKI